MGKTSQSNMMAIQSNNSGDFKDRCNVSAWETSIPMAADKDANLWKMPVFSDACLAMIIISSLHLINASAKVRLEKI